MNKYLLFIVFANSCYSLKYSSKQDCDVTSLHYNNGQNDTNKIIFINRVVFDTTANLINVSVVERSNQKPIQNAYVSLKQNFRELHDTTNEKGESQIFKNNFSGTWQMIVTHSYYQCLQVNDIIIGGGQWIKIKLLK